MFLNLLLLIVGMVLLVKGADWFVDGSSSIAKALKIPSLIIGLTLVSFGTSAPEASVSINAAIAGSQDIGLGNVVGSNIVNTLFILGLSAVIMPLVIESDMKKFDIPIMLGLYVVLFIFCFVITPYELARWQGIVMLLLFSGYMVFLVMRAKKTAMQTMADKDKQKSEDEKKKPLWLSIILTVIGLAAVIFGGDLVVDKASIIATELGMSEALVGLTIVAVGTSLPELVTSVVAAIKKEDDIAIGNVVGSNIFNQIFILGMASTISPLTVAQTAFADMLVMIGTGVILLIISLMGKKIKRWQGAVMIMAYIAYLTFIIIRG